MGNSWFQFQQFRVHQDRCAMKISTDAVLLGALARHHSPKRILDVGTGTGILALMLAQRFPTARLTALEIDPDAAAQAAENCISSPFGNRITVKLGKFQDFFEPQAFDLIVSNPPYFPNHLKSSDAKRNRALHADELPFEALLLKTKALLLPEGRFWVILPSGQVPAFLTLAEGQGLYPIQRIQVKDAPAKNVFREVLELAQTPLSSTPFSQEICLKEEDGTFTAAYASLLSGFLLGF
jgi:tRNA1Val (adenine37-N6)-methyltransferase